MTAGGSAILPQLPSPYALPGGALNVSTVAELVAALQLATPRDIVLAAGVYDSVTPFVNVNGHRIYSATLGAAALRAGLVMGGNFGPGKGLVQGVGFDVSDPSRTLLNSVIHVWGSGAGSRILDSTFNGHKVIGVAILARQPEGVVVQRVRVRDFTDAGVLVDANDPARKVVTPALLEDLDVAGISRAVPRSSNGTAEACVWLGNTGILRRALLRSCAWMGLWTGTANAGSLHEHLDIDGTQVGVYAEHFTTASTFQRMHIGPNVEIGVNCEWADPGWGGKPACTDNVVQDSTIASSRVGVHLDEGTTRTTVRRVKFLNQTWAAVRDYKGIDNQYYDNDYSGIASGAVAVAK